MDQGWEKASEKPQMRQPHRPAYENDWIWEGLRKHEANYSMVICFDTNDPARFEQLKNFLCYDRPKGYETHEIYVYDPWDGLGILHKDAKTSPYAGKVGQRFQEELSGKVQDLAQTLNIMDSKLRENATILVLHDLTEGIEGKIRLLSALRSWANSAFLVSNRSLIIILGFATSTLLDDETRDLVVNVEVKAGQDTEYERLIDHLAEIFGIANECEKEKGVLKSALKGLNLHQSESILRESYAFRNCFDLEQIKIAKGELVKRTGILEIEEPREDFEAIGGYEKVKEFINQKIIWVMHNPELAATFAIPLPRGILLFGPPGTGKTLFARALAKRIKLPFINLKTENIISKWLGESSQKMKTAIETAEQMSPAIVFTDEIDRFGRRTATTDSAGEETRRVFSQLLEWLGKPERKAIIVGTTNRPEDLDEAFLRTGRFDYKIPITYPDKEARLEILRIHLGLPSSPKPKPPLDLPDKEFLEFLKRKIVPATESYTGAELEELVIRAKRNAFERNVDEVRNHGSTNIRKRIIPVTSGDFEKVLKTFRVDRNARIQQSQKYMELTKKFTDDETFIEGLS
jgi:ATP-dependent 26S proteasome regulatory subunit